MQKFVLTIETQHRIFKTIQDPWHALISHVMSLKSKFYVKPHPQPKFKLYTNFHPNRRSFAATGNKYVFLKKRGKTRP